MGPKAGTDIRPFRTDIGQYASLVGHCLLCIIRQRKQVEAVYFWQIRSLYARYVPFLGSTVIRRMRG
jgi:hypothetical protein